MKSSNVSSSQKCLASLYCDLKRNPNSSYQRMFLEDFCRWFSIDLAKDKKERPFYDVWPEKSLLKELLTSQNYDFLEYDMDKLLTHVMRTLVFAGKSFVEVVLYSDEENNVVGVSLVPFDPILSVPGRNNTFFLSMRRGGKPKFFKISKRNIILFRLSDLGFKRNFLRKFYNKLPRYDILNVSDMSLCTQNTGFDLSVWNDKREYKLLKLSKKIGWYGRSTNNSYMGDAYLLYRAIQFKSLRISFLDYFLKQINESITVICKELGVDGTIVAKRISYNYDEILQKLHSGEINYSQLGDCIFWNKEVNPM